jgi:FKBP12-rapamycin complex-associated protein
MLSVLSIWFRYSRVENLIGTLEQCLLHVHGDTWLGVLPQLIARIDHPEPNARKLLHGLLSRLGAKHAQVLVYPLSVALKSPIEERQTVAESLINSLRQHFPALIDQFLVVSNELVRVAILWAEEWHECLEEASRQYYGEGNIIGMLETLTPMHRALNNGPTTMREASFVQAYGMN